MSWASVEESRISRPAGSRRRQQESENIIERRSYISRNGHVGITGKIGQQAEAVLPGMNERRGRRSYQALREAGRYVYRRAHYAHYNVLIWLGKRRRRAMKRKKPAEEVIHGSNHSCRSRPASVPCQRGIAVALTACQNGGECTRGNWACGGTDRVTGAGCML